MTITTSDTVDLVVAAFDLPEAIAAFHAPNSCRQQLRQLYSQLLIALGEDTASADTHVLREHLFRLCGMEARAAQYLFRVDQFDCSDAVLKRVRSDLLAVLIDRLIGTLQQRQAQDMLAHGCSVTMIMRRELIMQYFEQFRRPDWRERYPNFHVDMSNRYGEGYEQTLIMSHAIGIANPAEPVGVNDAGLMRLWQVFRYFGLPNWYSQT